MLYQVKIYDSNNHVKKIIGKKELSRRHWANFGEQQTNNVLPETIKKNLKIFKAKIFHRKS